MIHPNKQVGDKLDKGIEYLRKSGNAQKRYPGLLQLLEELKNYEPNIRDDDKEEFGSFICSVTKTLLADAEKEDGNE